MSMKELHLVPPGGVHWGCAQSECEILWPEWWERPPRPQPVGGQPVQAVVLLQNHSEAVAAVGTFSHEGGRIRC